MELNGTPVAVTSRMRERPASTTPSHPLQPASAEASAPREEPCPPAVDPDDGLDKYDISTLACTD
jgi:hypothetical protein